MYSYSEKSLFQGDATAAAKFQDAARAYETLKDPQKRALYDQASFESTLACRTCLTLHVYPKFMGM